LAALVVWAGAGGAAAADLVWSWDFEKDPVDRLPDGWALRSPVVDFRATVREEPGNRYLHLESRRDQGCPAVTASWGQGTPSPDWIYKGSIEFRIRFNIVNPMAFFRLRGNLPANGPRNDDHQLFFTVLQPGRDGGQAIAALDPAGFALPVGQWHNVRLEVDGVRQPRRAGDPYSRGNWKLTIGNRTAAGELGQPGQDLPFGTSLNSISFGKWFNDPVDFDIDDVRVLSDDPLPPTPAVVTGTTPAPPPAPAAVTPTEPAPRAPASAAPPASRLARVTVNGTTYENVRFGPVSGDRVVLFHTRGLIQVAIHDLPDDLRDWLRPPAVRPPVRTVPATAAPADATAHHPEPAPAPAAAPPPGPSPARVVNRFLKPAGGTSVVTGFIRSRVTVSDAGRPTAAVVFELAVKKDSARKVPRQLEMRPGLWDGTGAFILLKNYNFDRELDSLVRIRIVETRAIDNYRTFVVTGQY